VCSDHGLELVDTGMSYYVRTPEDRPGVTTEEMEHLGQKAAAHARGVTGASIADVLEAVADQGPVREALESRIEMSSASRTDQVTATGTLEHVASFTKQPSWRVRGGNQALPNAMADSLGNRVNYGHHVTAIAQHNESVLVSVNGRTEEFDYAVIALPYGIITEKDVLIDLPEWKRDALTRVTQGHAAKIHMALTSTPATSAVMSVDHRFWTWTACESPDEVAPILCGFGGELGKLEALGIREDSEEWERLVREQRSDLSISPDVALVTAWTLDPLAKGGYTAHGPDFTSSDHEALIEPVGRLHFAGEYADDEFVGLMEGALRSGIRASDRIAEDEELRTVA